MQKCVSDFVFNFIIFFLSNQMIISNINPTSFFADNVLSDSYQPVLQLEMVELVQLTLTIHGQNKLYNSGGALGANRGVKWPR